MIDIDRIRQLEELFSANEYNGIGITDFVIETGTIPVLVSVPHSVNHFRMGAVKGADIYTGGIGRYIQKMTDCHLMCSIRFSEHDPNYDPSDENQYQKILQKYIEENDIKVVIDLHGANQKREFAIEMGTAPEKTNRQSDPSLKEYGCIIEMVRSIFERQFEKIECEKEEIWKNRIFSAGGQNTITKFVYQNTKAIGFQLEVNRIYRDPENEKEMSALVEGLIEVVQYLSTFAWK